MLLKLGYSFSAWKKGIQAPFFWNTDTVPHLLISGITGGSKTVSSQMIVNQLLEHSVDMAICDFKAGGDWDNIIPAYAEYLDCDVLLKNFYSDFVETIHRKGRENKFLVFDEFSSYALSKDTKAFKELMSMISHIAFMGRSFGYHLIFISQQFNAKVLDTAIREQFGIKIYMGSVISTESATMLFPNCEIDKSAHLPKYCGYISMPEKDLDIIQMPYLENAGKLKALLEKKGKNNYQ
jgi:hypothetical protein